jgi:hypothetical protein
MPYKILAMKHGYKVCKKDDDKKCFSKMPMSHDKATKQIKALYIHMNKEKK